MPITEGKVPFTKQNIDKTPTSHGIFILYDASSVIYIGSSNLIGGIRTHLQRHKRGDEGFCTMRTRYFMYEICPFPGERKQELLDEYQKKYRQLPRCNGMW